MEAAAPAPVATRLNVDITQAMKDVQGVGVALGQLRTMAGELDERYRTLLQTCDTADQRRQDIESTFTRIDTLAQARLDQLTDAGELAARTEKMLARAEDLSGETDRQLAAIADARNLESTFARIDALAQARLGQLTDAGELAARTEKMLARVEGLSAETNRQLAAIADARNLVDRDIRDLARARAEAQSRARAVDAHSPAVVYPFDAPLARLKAALATIHRTAPRPSGRAIVYAALAVLVVAAIAATWPAESASRVEMPVVESRLLTASGIQPAALPPRLEVEAESPGARGANPVRAAVAGYVGELAVQSSPRGATVFVDGKPVGETPLSSVRIRAGSHAIWLELAKHQRWTTAIQVRAGALTTVNATLRAAPDGQRAR